jgi:acetate kinase
VTPLDEAILVLNAGSSSLKFSVFTAADELQLGGNLGAMLTYARPTRATRYPMHIPM